MSKAPKYHRAFGVYGICIENNSILVIDKIKGHTKTDMIYLVVV